MTLKDVIHFGKRNLLKEFIRVKKKYNRKDNKDIKDD